MALKLIQAAALPITLELLKAQLRVDTPDEDVLLQFYLDAAVEQLDGPEGILGRAIGTQTWELLMDEFPDGPMAFPIPPLQAVTSVKYLDAQGVERTVPQNEYAVDVLSSPGWLIPADSWPEVFGTPNAVTVRFVAGYVNTPARLQLAIAMLVADMMANREATIDRRLQRNRMLYDMLLPFKQVDP